MFVRAPAHWYRREQTQRSVVKIATDLRRLSGAIPVTQRSGELPGFVTVIGDDHDPRIKDPKDWVRYNGAPSQDFWAHPPASQDRCLSARPDDLGPHSLLGQGAQRLCHALPSRWLTGARAASRDSHDGAEL
jgi:hypothetical protein